MPEKGGPTGLRILYTLSDLPSLLSENEWWLDREASQLWMWVRGGGTPAQHAVEIKRHSFCVSALAPPVTHTGVAPPVHLSGLGLHGCTFELRGCNNCTVINVSAVYPSHAREVPFRNFPRPIGPAIAVTTLSGSDSRIDGLHLQHSSVTGLLIEGDRNVCREALIENTNCRFTRNLPLVVTFMVPF